MVTPFGLANTPSIFQKYINNALQEYLDWFCSAYLDNILIFTNSSKKEYIEHIYIVLKALKKAGLNLDILKYKFSIQKIKYLGFIIKARKGIRINPKKVKVI